MSLNINVNILPSLGFKNFYKKILLDIFSLKIFSYCAVLGIYYFFLIICNLIYYIYIYFSFIRILYAEILRWNKKLKQGSQCNAKFHQYSFKIISFHFKNMKLLWKFSVWKYNAKKTLEKFHAKNWNHSLPCRQKTFSILPLRSIPQLEKKISKFYCKNVLF